jgi:Pin2-interacting protein X1
MATLMTKKTIDALGSKISESKGSKISSFAQNYMKKLGWEEGKGLGKDEDGMASHIKVAKKEEASGLGLDKAKAEEASAQSENWWHDAFSSNLKTFHKKHKGATADKKSKKKRKREGEDGDEANNDEEDDASKNAPSFEDLFKATGGARLGMRARASQDGKFKRTEHLEGVKQLSLRNGEQSNGSTGSISISTSSHVVTDTETNSNDNDDDIDTNTTNSGEDADESQKRKKSKKEKKEKKEKKSKKDKREKKSKSSSEDDDE